MAKVTLILEDATDKKGRSGMSVDVKIDPPMEEDKDPTVAQAWGAVILEMIMDASKEVVMVDDEKQSTTIKEDKNGTGELH